MAKSKSRKKAEKPTRMQAILADILAGTISGLIVLAVEKLLNH